MEAYLIVGEPNSRKSSVLRGLTGCFNRSIRDIQLTTGKNIELYARVSSVQESKTTPEEFLEEALSKKLGTVVFCLWPDANPQNPKLYPDADAYVSVLRGYGWNFVATAVLGPKSCPLPLPRVRHFPNVRTDPVNMSSLAVRLHFGWA